MNYLAHARPLLRRPWAVIGSSLTDWVRILDRRVRLRGDDIVHDPDSPEAELRVGIRRHEEDNRRFHASAEFQGLQRSLAREIRHRFPDRPERRMRAGFYAHLLVEMLLDAAIAEREPETIDTYYGVLDATDPDEVVRLTRPLVPAHVVEHHLPAFIRRFRELRFLADYADDGEILRRLDQVGRRLRQPSLPEGFRPLIPPARELVRDRAFRSPTDWWAWA